MENAEKVGELKSLSLEGIKEVLPHRGRWLLLKEVIFLEKDIIGVATDFSKELCEGHFEKRLIVPGALLAEAMKQAAAFMVMFYSAEDVLPMIRKETFSYKMIVLPEERIEIEVRLNKEKNSFYFFEGEARRKDETIMTGEFVGVRIK